MKPEGAAVVGLNHRVWILLLIAKPSFKVAVVVGFSWATGENDSKRKSQSSYLTFDLDHEPMLTCDKRIGFC